MFRSIIRHTYVLLGALCLLTTTSRADVRTALASGNWSVAATWSSGHSPEDGDTLIIPAGITVSVTANLSYSGEAMRIRIYGTLFFNGSGSKLSLPCNSIVELMTTEATMAGNASGSSQTLKICNTAVWSVGANNNAHGPADYPTGATLPVELLYFTGDTREAMVQLRWSTGSEMNSDHFELRRSQDGAEGSVIASVAAAGSSQQVSTYGLEDAPPGAGTWYYRLVQYDTDGTADDLATIAVEVSAVSEFRCLTMPASGELVIISQDLRATVVLRDLEGRMLMQAPLTGRRTTLSIGGLPDGPYLVQAVGSGMNRTQRIVVVH